jgi:hypothetical protein
VNHEVCQSDFYFQLKIGEKIIKWQKNMLPSDHCVTQWALCNNLLPITAAGVPSTKFPTKKNVQKTMFEAAVQLIANIIPIWILVKFITQFIYSNRDVYISIELYVVVYCIVQLL